MRCLAMLGIASAVTLLLSGCGSVTTSVSSGVPAGWEGPVPTLIDGTPSASWLEGHESFGIATFGSSSCPYTASSMQADSDDAISIQFTSNTKGPCTADFGGPTTHVFAVPPEASGRPLTVTAWFNTDSIEFTLP